MKILIPAEISRILKNKKIIERELNVKITNKGEELSIDGNAEEEYITEKVIDALSYNFPISVALLIKTEDFDFETINIKDHTRRKDMKVIKARIIGKGGKTLKTFHNLTRCYFELKDNSIGIIGSPEHIKNAHDAIIFLIQGSKHTNVYKFLEEHQLKNIADLGLKKTN